MRITDPSGATFVYSGDTGACDALVDLARGADVFLVRGVLDAFSGAAAGAAPVGHRGRAGRGHGRCRELLLTHIPPWTSREDVISEAKAEFDGPVHAVVCGETFDVTR